MQGGWRALHRTSMLTSSVTVVGCELASPRSMSCFPGAAQELSGASSCFPFLGCLQGVFGLRFPLPSLCAGAACCFLPPAEIPGAWVPACPFPTVASVEGRSRGDAGRKKPFAFQGMHTQHGAMLQAGTQCTEALDPWAVRGKNIYFFFSKSQLPEPAAPVFKLARAAFPGRVALELSLNKPSSPYVQGQGVSAEASPCSGGGQ